MWSLLWAVEDFSNPIVITVVGMVLASLGAAVTAVMSYLTNRDKLAYDADRIRLEKDVTMLKAQDERCRQDIAQLRQDRDGFREEVERLQTQREGDARETRQLREELDELRRRPRRSGQPGHGP